VTKCAAYSSERVLVLTVISKILQPSKAFQNIYSIVRQFFFQNKHVRHTTRHSRGSPALPLPWHFPHLWSNVSEKHYGPVHVFRSRIFAAVEPRITLDNERRSLCRKTWAVVAWNHIRARMTKYATVTPDNISAATAYVMCLWAQLLVHLPSLVS
jgi:hypothetical protein